MGHNSFPVTCGEAEAAARRKHANLHDELFPVKLHACKFQRQRVRIDDTTDFTLALARLTPMLSLMSISYM